uniref:Uncharacterized protein n=1 Tax=Strigamia maritima TaxID=126957 RepID=T1J2H2_STRMM
MFNFKNLPFSPSRSPVQFDRPMVIQQAPKGGNNDIPVPFSAVDDIKHHYQCQPDDMMSVNSKSWEFEPASNVKTNFKEELENWENTFHMRPFNLNNFPTGQSTYRTTHRSQTVAIHRARIGYVSSTAKSLEILRQSLQKSINKDLDDIIKKYVDKFFKPGIENIKKNNGSNSVGDEHVQTVCRQMLEEAKKMYTTSHTRGSTPIGDSDSEVGSQTEAQMKFGRPFSRSPVGRKRKDSDTDSEASQIPVKKKKGRPPLHLSGGASGRSTPSKNKNEPIKREGPKWNPERLTNDLLFVMGARANKALGFGLTRGRLYIKHPELFKYCGDADDKQWLYENNLMPATGGKAYILILNDIQELAESEEYRNAPGIILNELLGFRPPNYMLEKMRIYMNAMRTDVPGRKHRGRPFASLENNAETSSNDQTFEIKTETIIEFTSASPASTSSAAKRIDLESSVPGSPVDDLDLRDTDPSTSQASPFLIPMGLDDVSPANDVSPSVDDFNVAMESADEPPLSAPFDISESP